ncbi:hypothetical protein Lumi_115 [Xylophilus phage Lumi]|nr:hypothetical protein Lumi_115 [Xylophilus phage Lumi]
MPLKPRPYCANGPPAMRASKVNADPLRTLDEHSERFGMASGSLRVIFGKSKSTLKPTGVKRGAKTYYTTSAMNTWWAEYSALVSAKNVTGRVTGEL